MKRGHERRLKALEEVKRRALGYRCFRQSRADPGLFLDEQGQAITDAEIAALGAAGWQVIRIVYKSPPGAGDTIRLTWGDEQPAAG